MTPRAYTVAFLSRCRAAECGRFLRAVAEGLLLDEEHAPLKTVEQLRARTKAFVEGEIGGQQWPPIAEHTTGQPRPLRLRQADTSLLELQRQPLLPH